jgi:hypothetical protein
MVKESYPIHTFINQTGDNGWNRNGHRKDCLINQLSTDLTNETEQVARSIVTMEDQLDSLASVGLQNRRRLDLLTAERSKGGGLCLFLKEECCFYVNQLGIVRYMAQQLQDQVT